MLSDLSTSPLFLAAVILGVLGAVLIVAGIAALIRARPLKFALRTLVGLLFISVGACAGTIAIGIQGYRALTREDVAARLTVRPLGPQRFAATVHFPDGRTAIYDLAGDEIYIDAHILKWKPLANLVGLHTVYELDRVEGRYRAIEQERSGVRTVHSLGQEKLLDLFTLRQRYPFLATLVDAEYGSATFATVRRPADLEVRVSTTGLLIRDAKPLPK
jgi:hypothetical protein